MGIEAFNDLKNKYLEEINAKNAAAAAAANSTNNVSSAPSYSEVLLNGFLKSFDIDDNSGQITTNVEDLQNELDATLQEGGFTTVDQAKKALNDAKIKAKEAEEAYLNATKDVEDQRIEYDMLDKEVSDIQSKIDTYKGDNKKLEDENKGLQEQNDKIPTENDVYTQEIYGLKQDIAVYDKEIGEIENKISDLKTKLQYADDSEKSDIQRQILVQEDKLDKRKTKKKECESKIKEKEKAIKDNNKLKEKNEKTIKNNQAKIDKNNNKISELEDKMNPKKERMEELSSEIQEKCPEFEKLRQEATKAAEDVSFLTNLVSKAEKLEKKIKALGGDIKEPTKPKDEKPEKTDDNVELGDKPQDDIPDLLRKHWQYLAVNRPAAEKIAYAQNNGWANKTQSEIKDNNGVLIGKIYVEYSEPSEGNETSPEFDYKIYNKDGKQISH